MRFAARHLGQTDLRDGPLTELARVSFEFVLAVGSFAADEISKFLRIRVQQVRNFRLLNVLHLRPKSVKLLLVRGVSSLIKRLNQLYITFLNI